MNSSTLIANDKTINFYKGALQLHKIAIPFHDTHDVSQQFTLKQCNSLSENHLKEALLVLSTLITRAINKYRAYIRFEASKNAYVFNYVSVDPGEWNIDRGQFLIKHILVATVET